MSERKPGWRVQGRFWLMSTHVDLPVTAEETRVFHLHPPPWALDNPPALRTALIGMAEMQYLLTIQAMLRCGPLSTPEMAKRFRDLDDPDMNIYVRSSHVEWTKP
jgi:hypothetical protein